MEDLGRAFLVLAALIVASPSFAKDVPDKPDSAKKDNADRLTKPSFGPVACHSKSLTVCQGDFCFVRFDHPSDETMLFDFAKGTYVNPMIGIEAKAMKSFVHEAAGDNYSAKFTIDLVGGPATVEFIENKGEDRQLTMSAAVRSSYPKHDDRPPIIVITAMECQKAVP